MNLRSGIPNLLDVDRLTQTDEYKRHFESNAAFLRRHEQVMAPYRKRWEFDPYQLWSRRWEYPFVGRQTLMHADRLGRSTPMTLLDAGSGVTYLPHMLCQDVPGLKVTACDYDTSYVPMFESICRAEGHGRVEFKQADMRKLPMAAESYDIVLCVSVLEHTDQYGQILSEFLRVLKPGGLLAMTFDLSLDDKFELSRKQATELLGQVSRDFHVPAEIDAVGELNRLNDPGPLLSTDAIRRTAPQLLPWRRPWLKAVHDLLHGHGWTGGFRSKSVYCIGITKPQ
jgi:2-polyprenyl-3-methyl-5-hydroxy-6-metoxy-1,4-benzoquinol methylase